MILRAGSYGLMQIESRVVAPVGDLKDMAVGVRIQSIPCSPELGVGQIGPCLQGSEFAA